MSHIIKSLGSITWSDIIEIAGIIASTITSIIAIAISVKSYAKTIRCSKKALALIFKFTQFIQTPLFTS